MDIQKEKELHERWYMQNDPISYQNYKLDIPEFSQDFGQSEKSWLAAKAHALQEKLQGVVLTCNQLKEALEYGAPDLFSKTQGQKSDIEFQLGTEMAIEYTKDGHSGSGYYCWYSDLPEEGSILLGTEFVAQEQGQAVPEGFVLVPREPTAVMLEAGNKEMSAYYAWKGMVKAWGQGHD